MVFTIQKQLNIRFINNSTGRHPVRISSLREAFRPMAVKHLLLAENDESLTHIMALLHDMAARKPAVPV